MLFGLALVCRICKFADYVIRTRNSRVLSFHILQVVARVLTVLDYECGVGILECVKG